MARRAADPSPRHVGDLPALLVDELPHGTLALAKFLLGKVLVRDGPDGRQTGRIVETEAYPPGDEAGHARSGRTARNASLFLGRGHVYVYRAYGISMMLNISSEREGVGAGVLIRALEPLSRPRGDAATARPRRHLPADQRGPGASRKRWRSTSASTGRFMKPAVRYGSAMMALSRRP